ncbi:MAG: Mitochondrial translocator assembly and maintenance protein 41 [Geoglossum simile]|nr:MAG: Mitochondrial translocator assembly and maintenance protein 41 [Geoglossum simile]
MAAPRNILHRLSSHTWPAIAYSRLPSAPGGVQRRPDTRFYAAQSPQSPQSSSDSPEDLPGLSEHSTSPRPNPPTPSTLPSPTSPSPPSAPPDWDENPNFNISAFSQLPHSNFGVNQHILINNEFKEALRQILWQFRAPIRYAFAYGSGVFPQGGPNPSGPPNRTSTNPTIVAAQGGNGKMIDFIFGVSHTQHWHSLNLQQHRNHYSALGYLGSAVVSQVQDRWGAGVYFNPYVTVNGTLIKYGVVNLDTLCRDLSEWDTLYLAGRLQKPVKILRDNPRVRLANQVNLLSALRTSLLLLPSTFTEQQLYGTIAGISYLGDPRMSLPTENPHKVANIVRNQLPIFRRLYAPLVENLPNVSFQDPRCSNPSWANDPTTDAQLKQDMDPVKRGNMVQRLPKSFRAKLYSHYQRKFKIPDQDFEGMMEACRDEDATGIRRRNGGELDRRIANDLDGLRKELGVVIKRTINWPSTSQSIKGLLTSGVGRTRRYIGEKIGKWRDAK